MKTTPRCLNVGDSPHGLRKIPGEKMPLKTRLGITAVLQRQPTLSLCCVLCIPKMIIDEIKALTKLAESNISCSVLQMSKGFSPYRYVYRTVQTTKTWPCSMQLRHTYWWFYMQWKQTVWFHCVYSCLFQNRKSGAFFQASIIFTHIPSPPEIPRSCTHSNTSRWRMQFRWFRSWKRPQKHGPAILLGSSHSFPGV